MDVSAASYKEILFQKCVDYVKARIETAQQAMNNAQAAANEEGKSSAGDKYETGRAMMQIERDKAAEQLNEALQINKFLEGVKLITQTQVVGLGSLIFCGNANFYVAISAGKLVVEGHEFMAISPQTPIGQQLYGKKEGDSIEFNKTIYTIQRIS
jgi:transcription elongation GreA/GreB family factor